MGVWVCMLSACVSVGMCVWICMFMHEGLSVWAWGCVCGCMWMSVWVWVQMNARMCVCEGTGVRVWIYMSVCMCECVCVSVYAHMSGCALQTVLSCSVGVLWGTGILSSPGSQLCWSCLGPGRPLPKVEKVCWRFRGPGLRDPSSPAENPPSPWGSGWGCLPPKVLAVGGAGTRPQHVLLPLFFLLFWSWVVCCCCCSPTSSSSPH